MFTALTSLAPPGSLVFGYRRGDEIPPNVVEDWHLVAGQDYVEGELPADQPVAGPLMRPTEADTRATWEAWAIANGMSEQDAAEASQEDLEAVEGQSVEADTDPNRPADSAKKADWADYAISRGADPAWANDSNTTKANLQAYDPAEVGDPVAIAATEQT